jgi:hypothetical protein
MLPRPGRGTTLSQRPDLLRELGYLFQERAAIHEYDGDLPADQAQRLAWLQVEQEWCSILSTQTTRSREPRYC